MRLVPGSKIGAYEIVAALGEGGMGQVYRARDTRLDRDVALKILPELFASDADRLARFDREAKSLAALNHPNIAAIYGIEEKTSGVFSGGTDAEKTPDVFSCALVMELVEGDDLSVLIARGAMPLSEVVPIARQIADALEAAHESGIVHRDLKPANIKVRADGTVKVLDFGLAKATDPAGTSGASAMNSPTLTARATQMGMIIGTAAYMAPEQARGRSVDRRADIWAFGAVLYEMLTGRRAFEGDDISVTLAAVIKDDVNWSALPSDLPPSVRRLLRRCLEKDPKQRLSAIGDARLELIETTEPTLQAAAAPVRVERRNAWPWLLAGAIAGVAVTALVMFQWLRPQGAPTEAMRLTIMAPENTELFPDSRQSTISPDGRAVTFVTGTITGLGSTQLWVRSLAAPAPRLIDGAAGAQLPFWSPDSRRIGFFAEGKLKIVSADGGRVEVVCDAPDARGGAWSPSGVIVFAPTSAGPLMRVNATGGDPVPATSLDTNLKETGHRFPFFLPDGRHFLFATLPTRSGLFDIVAGSLDSSDRVAVLAAASGVVYSEPGFLLFSRKGVAVAQRFDAANLRVIGDAVPLDDAPGAVGNQYSAGPAVSAAAGTLLYLNDPFARTRLAWVDLTGRELDTITAPPARYVEVHLSPDERQLGVVRSISAAKSALWVLDLERKGATRLAEDEGLSYQMTWSPDGRRVAYAKDSAGPEQLFIRDMAAAMPETRIFESAALFKKPRSWSPDGSLLMFNVRLPDTQGDLMTVPVSGATEATPYLQDSFNEDGGEFSPDGRWVVYVSDESGSNDVYLRSFPTPDRKHRVTTDGGIWATWNSTGTQLMVIGADGRQVKSVDVRLGTDATVGLPRIVGTLPAQTIAWDASRDLSRLVVAVPATGSQAMSLTVVHNWQSAVK